MKRKLAERGIAGADHEAILLQRELCMQRGEAPPPLPKADVPAVPPRLSRGKGKIRARKASDEKRQAKLEKLAAAERQINAALRDFIEPDVDLIKWVSREEEEGALEAAEAAKERARRAESEEEKQEALDEAYIKQIPSSEMDQLVADGAPEVLWKKFERHYTASFPTDAAGLEKIRPHFDVVAKEVLGEAVAAAAFRRRSDGNVVQELLTANSR